MEYLLTVLRPRLGGCKRVGPSKSFVEVKKNGFWFRNLVSCLFYIDHFIIYRRTNINILTYFCFYIPGEFLKRSGLFHSWLHNKATSVWGKMWAFTLIMDCVKSKQSPFYSQRIYSQKHRCDLAILKALGVRSKEYFYSPLCLFDDQKQAKCTAYHRQSSYLTLKALKVFVYRHALKLAITTRMGERAAYVIILDTTTF